MLKVNHTIISVAGGLAAVSLVRPELVANPQEFAGALSATVAGAFIGSLAPDYDLKMPEPIARFLFKVLFLPFPKLRKRKIDYGHRTYSHSILSIIFFLIVVGIMSLFVNSDIVAGGLGFVFGYIFHLIADMTTVSGVPLLWPFSQKKYHILPKPLLLVTGKSPFERVYALIMVFICLSVFISRFNIS